MKTNDFDQVLRNYTEEEILLRKMKYQERLAFVKETGLGFLQAGGNYLQWNFVARMVFLQHDKLQHDRHYPRDRWLLQREKRL